MSLPLHLSSQLRGAQSIVLLEVAHMLLHLASQLHNGF